MNDQQEFWRWFVQHQDELFDFEIDQERIFDSLSASLQKVEPHLTFEFGPKGAQREFIISAGGIKSAFPAVISLVRAAPLLPRWRITAFRPRRKPPEVIVFRDKHVQPKDVQFSLLDNGKTVGIRLFIPSFKEDDIDWRQIGYLLLDDALGEYDVESRLGFIKMYSPDASTTEKRYAFAELPLAFDRVLARLEVRPGDPS